MLTADQRMISFERIAVLTDLGDDLEKTLAYTAALCNWYDSELLLFHTTSKKAMEEAREQLTALLEEPAWSGIRSKVIVSKDNMGEALGQLDTYSPNLLVLTTRAKKNVRKWVAGSATQEVFRQTHRPVLVLGPEITKRERVAPKAFSNILYATDMSGVSVMALHFAAAIAFDHGAQLTVLYVDTEPERGSTSDHIMAEQRLRDWMKDHIGGMARAIEHAEIRIAFGEPAEHILENAGQLKPDLIVMGAHGMGAMAGLASRFLGGTTYDVCCHSKTPLLIVPEPH